MKNLKRRIFEITALTVIALFMSSSVLAQVQQTQQDTTTRDTTMQTDQQQTLPQEQNQQTIQGIDSQEPDESVDYSESVDKSELPQEVNSSLDELYPAHEISEVYRGADDSYKVKVKNENDEAVIYYDSEGKFLRAENLSGLQQEGALPQEQGQRTNESQDQQGADQQGTDDRQNQQDDQEDESEIDADHSQYEPGTMQNHQGTGTEDAEMQEEHDMDMMNESSAHPQEQNQQADEKLKSQDRDKGVDYSETIEKGDLPQEITSSLEELYPAHEIEEAFKGNDVSYKVKLKNEDDKAVIFYNSEGEFLRAQNESGLQQEGVLPQEQGQRTQDQKEWGTDDHQKQQGTQGQSETDADDTDNQQGQLETQGATEAWGDTTQNESSAYPQELNQRTQEQTWGTQGERTSDWDSEDSTQINSAPVDTIASPQEQFQRGAGDVDFSEEIEANELPESVTSSLNELYPDHEVEKVYRGDDDSYKIKVKNNDDHTTVYFDSDGLFSRVEDMKDMMPKDENEDTNQDW